ncbi:TatD family hydrolase [Phytohalomonas tamaricis]|uniref:TatD family hydrolase n=1 Tax=Phytohalomonas tamaricis TaxID=2081032 RepID=UPI000D0B7A21|nr:TatD family hydrolase [Phytohalomonas tamaricis]
MNNSFNVSSASAVTLVDSHCHLDQLDLSGYAGGLSEALDAARAQGVRQFMAIATDMGHLDELVRMARQHDDVVYSAGVHPMTRLEVEYSLDEIREYIERFEPVAVGEVGLDYIVASGEQTPYVLRDVQYERFRNHLIAANEGELPVIVHTRGAKEDTLALIREYTDPAIGGVLHCFTEDIDMAREAIRHGFYISLSGIVTFHSAENVRELARQIPLDRLLIETDSPYLAPVPHRGKPNEPRHVIEVARTIANVRGISLDEVAMQTTANFYRLFRNAAPQAPQAVLDQLGNLS